MPTTKVYSAGDLCTEALRDAGIVGVDLAPSAETLEVAIKRLNFMLKAWQNDAVTVWKQETASITVTADTQSYTIAARPLSLDVVNYKDTLETPLYQMARREYFELPDKASTGRPSQFYYQKEREQGVLYVWPVLGAATGTIEWSGRVELEDVEAPADLLDVPGEWYEAVLYGLASRLASAFSKPRPDLASLAAYAYDTARGADVDGSIFLAVE